MYLTFGYVSLANSTGEGGGRIRDPMKLKDYVWDKLVRYHAWWGFDLENDKFMRFSLWMTLVTLITGVVLTICLFVL